MRNRLLRSVFAITLLTVILLRPPLLVACGPFALEAVFTFTVHPEYPLEKFARGDFGVVQRTFARSYLYVAYRQLTGSEFNPQQQKALVDLWRDRLDYRWEPNDQQWVQKWLTARAKVAGLGQSPKIEVYRNREKPNEYETYLNCQRDAFENAAATLEARVKHFGIESPVIKDWVTAQDQVFANCSEGQHLPASAPPEADSLIRADRIYQVAAADFYSSNFNAAQKLFESIAEDSTSPWRQTAPYLVARTLLRKASLGAAEGKNDALSEAERHLNNILKDPSLTVSYEAAKRLLNIVRIRLHPETRLHELAQSLLRKNQDDNLKQDLWDYTVLLDGFLGNDDAEEKSELPDSIRNDDLTDWIVTFQSQRPEALGHSLDQWQAKSSLPWLIASLARIDVHDPKAVKLLSAVSRITPESPAFATVSFHAVRLLMQGQRFDEARTRIDELLQKYRGRFNTSSLNLLLSQRMLLANSLDDFLTHAQRVAAGFSWNEDGREIPADASETDEIRSLQGRTLFDWDAAQLLNREVPLDKLKEAAVSRVLPNNLRRDLAQAVWLRAILLGNLRTADELIPALRALIPDLSPFLDDYLSTKQADAKRFSALYAWLKFPGLEPIIDSGVGRQTPLGEQDPYRDNWWCSSALPPQTDAESSVGQEMPKTTEPFSSIRNGMSPFFLNDSQRAAAERELAALRAIGAAPNYLCQQVVQWATKSPNDARVPEALHLAVKTTRYGCTDKQTGKWSKTAYDLLHTRYSSSVWAKRTPYWFKD